MEWKQIEDYPNYFVSNTGLVRNKKGKILAPIRMEDYLTYNLYLNNKSSKKLAHRLVALAFLSNPENKPCVDHIDRDKHNNKIENLRFATYLENSRNSDRFRKSLEV